MDSGGKVLLVGAGGKTGQWYARVLLADNKIVYGYDKNSTLDLPEDITRNPNFIRVKDNQFEDLSILEKVDSVTLSPGVPLSLQVFSAAMERGLTVFSELEYCSPRFNNNTVVGITGTDGKSTTTDLLTRMLESQGKKAIACGNFGISFARILAEKLHLRYDYLVAELSSYQLERCSGFAPEVAIYLNLAPDHLDRYTDLEAYGLAKWNIIGSMKNGATLVVEKTLLPGGGLWKGNHPLDHRDQLRVIVIDSEKLKGSHFHWNDSLILNSVQKNSDTIIERSKTGISGNHNLNNILFALEALYTLAEGKIDIKSLNHFLHRYHGLPHRFEIFKRNDNLYIDDSKATTTQAAAIAIENAPEPVYLFMGGRSKGEDYNSLVPYLQKKDIKLFLYGENRGELENVFTKAGVDIISVKETLDQSYKAATELQASCKIPSVTYLLSPASTSWDQFSSFEERGEHFKKLVLAEEKDPET